MPRRKSRRYAQALFVLAEKQDAVEAVNGSLQILSDLYERDTSFRLLFYTRKIDPARKADILSSVLGDQVHPVALGFLAILAEKGDQSLLMATTDRYEALYRKRTNRVSVTTVTSVSLKEQEYEDMHRRLESSLRKQVDLKKEVDPRLLGGITLRIDNTFLDGSVSTRLEKLKDSLV